MIFVRCKKKIRKSGEVPGRVRSASRDGSLLVRGGLVFFFVVILGLSLGCADRQLENAFSGDYSAEKNNKTIHEYCISCHIHKNFIAEEHIAAVRTNYKRSFFKKSGECRDCHYLEKDWVRNRYDRRTRYPAKANRGAYRSFEKSHKDPLPEEEN